MRFPSIVLAALLVGACGGTSDEGDDGGASCAAGRPPTRTASCVVSFEPGEGAGHGGDHFPHNVFGEPSGGGLYSGAMREEDVLSLGAGGEIVVGFGGNSIVDSAGPDFIVFENAFFISGTTVPYEELGEVSVSEDGETWHTFECASEELPYTGCAGWRPVLANPDTGVSSLDPEVAGGEAFDLADVGVSSARLVRIVDLSDGEKIEPEGKEGFDLDAIAIVNAAVP